MDVDNKWVENDKVADMRCFLDLQCPADKCCANYPDGNNRRCMLRTEHDKPITVGPASFTPSCPSIKGGNKDVVPENAQDDIAKGALSEANDAL